MVKDFKGTETNSTIEIMKEGQIVYTIHYETSSGLCMGSEQVY